ncbi:speedy protein E4-like [Sorex araneus]|uniref:speedy protein E4-like n=1 Tax=Sorex araneus TaxID=42254 RepID=UPI002433C544|nr:speedy protein E4-like [Sorex araneus]
MASLRQSPGSEPQSPQSSTSGYPLEVSLEDMMPGPSGRYWGLSSRSGGEIPRGWKERHTTGSWDVWEEVEKGEVWGSEGTWTGEELLGLSLVSPSESYGGPWALAGDLKRKREQLLYEEELEEEEEEEESPGVLDMLMQAGVSPRGQKRRMWSLPEVEEEQGEPVVEQEDDLEKVEEQEDPEEPEKVEEEEKEQEEDEEKGDTASQAPQSGLQSGPRPQGGVRRKRDPSEEEEQQEDEEQPSGLCRKRRRQESPVLPEHHQVFRKLLEDPVVRRFLAWDRSLMVSDKYLLAMVVAYFSRSGLFCWQIRRIHFFLALYLASDMEEDNQAPKQSIFAFLYGQSRLQRPLFHRLRLQLLRSMGWRAWVTREECEQIQAYEPELWVWSRDRARLT